MKRLPDWTKEEIEILVRNNSLSVESISARLPLRTPAAIQVIRNGIYEFHQKGDLSLLSKMMKDRIAKPEIDLVCPICGENIDAEADR